MSFLPCRIKVANAEARVSGIPVVQDLEDATGEILYTIRTQAGRFHPRDYSNGKHTVFLGLNIPKATILSGVESKMKDESGQPLNVMGN